MTSRFDDNNACTFLTATRAEKKDCGREKLSELCNRFFVPSGDTPFSYRIGIRSLHPLGFEGVHLHHPCSLAGVSKSRFLMNPIPLTFAEGR